MMSISPVAGHPLGASIQNPGQYPIGLAGLGCLIDAVTIISPSAGGAKVLVVLIRADVQAASGLPAAPWPSTISLRPP
jgi:hypothetical protein